MFRRFFCAISCVTLVSACGSSHGQWIPPGLGIDQLMPLPQPFKAHVKTISPASGANAENDVTITSIAGLSPNDARQLAEAISRAAEPSDILVATRLTDRQTSLLEAAATLTPAKGGRHIAINFNLRHPDGTLAHRFTIEGDDPGAQGELDPETIVALSRSTADSLASAMGVTPVAEAPPMGKMPSIYLSGVAGAPGDGNRSLTTAMTTVLSGDGLPLIGDRKRADFILSGRVDISPNPDGSETIRIVWHILSPKGAELGKIEQSNAIAKGSLRGVWGDTAYDIANAAEEGLLEALQRLTSQPQTAAPAAKP
jgi:hypothetical protein